MNKTLVRQWVSKIGRERALIRLIENGASPRTAENLVDDKYNHEPKRRILAALTNAMSKDGFSLAAKKAS